MSPVSKTLGPLHFEDLEPKRFEDLTRQLIYDFRSWRRLEATGRSGSDDGFDARGYEMVNDDSLPLDDGADDDTVIGATDRLWLVQCKRERTITPKKLAAYLDDTKLTDGENLHGIVFAAACDFSKTARDAFSQKCEALGLREWHLWGKAELEDKLMRPESDGLLFAYFGVSLTIRRRSQRADLRARLVMKRKVNRLLGPKENMDLLLRSPDALAYPCSHEVPDFEKQPQWVVRNYRGTVYAGLTFCIQRYFAFLSDDGSEWDAAKVLNDALQPHSNPWAHDTEVDHRSAIWEIWDKLPEQNKAWFEVSGLIPFDEILDIDEIGDEYVSEPHLYVSFQPMRGPFRAYQEKIETVGRFDKRTADPRSAETKRIKVFPDEFREPLTERTGNI